MTVYKVKRAKFEGVGYSYLTLPAQKIQPGDGLIIEFGTYVASNWDIENHAHEYQEMITVRKVVVDEEFDEVVIFYRKWWSPFISRLTLDNKFMYSSLEKGYAVIVADGQTEVER